MNAIDKRSADLDYVRLFMALFCSLPERLREDSDRAISVAMRRTDEVVAASTGEIDSPPEPAMFAGEVVA